MRIFAEAFCRESENLEKVRRAFSLLFKEWEEKRVKLAFSTRLIILRCLIEGEEARKVYERIKHLPHGEEKVGEMVRLVFKLDKQKAYLGELREGKGDIIKIVVMAGKDELKS